MRKCKKEIFIMVNLFFSIVAITMSIFIFLKTFSYEFEKCGNIFKEIYLMRLNFLELLMVVITAILAILSIAVPLMAYNWNRDMKADFEKLKRDMKDDYRNMKESMCEDMKKVQEAQNFVSETKKDIQDLNRNIRNDMNSFSYNFLTNEIADTDFLTKIKCGDLSFLKDISTGELKRKFKLGKFSEVHVNHLLAMAKNCSCEDKKEIIANLKNIRKEAH